MKFIDQAKIHVIGGKGGNGIISFRREKKVAKGGPDGGNGGNGGSIYFVGDSGLNTLVNLSYQKIIRGINGQNGSPKNQNGKKGQDILIKVPLGTLVYFQKNLLHDIVNSKQYLIASGGKGGKGNNFFKSSVNPAPRLSENGLEGQNFVLDIELKMLADVGLIGKPSVGKSSLINALTNTSSKVANYHFTTLNPQLGVVKNNHDYFIVADLPGLIKGASQGKGLGHKFLRHIERCRILGHVVDLGLDQGNPYDDYLEIRKELELYSPNLAKVKELIIANKSDLPNFEKNLIQFKQKIKDREIVVVSALKHFGIKELQQKLAQLIQSAPLVNIIDYAKQEITIDQLKDEDQIILKKINPHLFEISGAKVWQIYQRIPLNSFENLRRFNYKLQKLGLWDKLIETGVKLGDTIKIFDYQFEWKDEL